MPNCLLLPKLNQPLKLNSTVFNPSHLPRFLAEGFIYQKSVLVPIIPESTIAQMQELLKVSPLTFFFESKKQRLVVYGNSQAHFYKKFKCEIKHDTNR